MKKSLAVVQSFITSAERVGFEPTVQFNPYDDLANRSFRPLRHLSNLYTYQFTFIRFRKPILSSANRRNLSNTLYSGGGKNKDLCLQIPKKQIPDSI